VSYRHGGGAMFYGFVARLRRRSFASVSAWRAREPETNVAEAKRRRWLERA